MFYLELKERSNRKLPLKMRGVCVCVNASAAHSLSHVGSRQGSLHSMSWEHRSGVRGCKATGGGQSPTSTNWWKAPTTIELSISALTNAKAVLTNPAV